MHALSHQSLDTRIVQVVDVGHERYGQRRWQQTDQPRQSIDALARARDDDHAVVVVFGQTYLVATKLRETVCTNLTVGAVGNGALLFLVLTLRDPL